MKVNEELSLLLLLEKARATKDGKATITIRITVKSQRKEISLGVKVHPDLWNQEAGIARGNTIDARNINSVIDKAKAKLRTVYDQLGTQHDYVSAAMVKEAYHGKSLQPEPSKMLLEAFTIVLERLEKKVEKNIRAKGTLRKWKTTKEKVIAFLQHSTKTDDIALEKVQFSFAEDFIDYLMLEKDLQSNYAMKQLKNVKHVFRTAVDKGWILKNPVSSFPCTYVNPERDILTMDEIMVMYHKKMPVDRLEEVKNIYLFMCFTGYAFIDMSILSPQHVCKYLDGEDWIVKNREKTWCRENVPLLPIAKELIELYKDHPFCIKHNLLFPVKSNQNFNAYLKEVADICGINKILTAHTARHTFATTITLANGVPLETVSALLGHKSIRTTQIYAKIVAKKVSEDMNALKEKLFIVMPPSMRGKIAA